MLSTVISQIKTQKKGAFKLEIHDGQRRKAALRDQKLTKEPILLDTSS